MSGTYVIKSTPLGPRVRGLRARYLSKDKLNALLLAQTLDDALNVLKGTDYDAIVEKIGKTATEAQITNEVKTHIVHIISSLSRSAPAPASRVLKAYLMRFEIENIKAIARSLLQGIERASYEELINVAVEEELGRRHVLALIMSTRDLEDLRNRLVELNHPAAQAINTFMRIGKQYATYSTTLLDTLMERVFVELILSLSHTDNTIRGFAEPLVNYYNLNIILRGKLWGLPQELVNELLIKEGVIASIGTKLYSESITRVLEEAASVFPYIDQLIKVAGTSDLRTLVQYLGPFNYRFARDLEESLIALYTEFAPGPALASAHLKATEGEVVIALLNSFIEGVPRDFMVKLYGPVIM
ncbi:V-type ATPase subunit [Vulcanisaeta thermophila]|uniref:V-type ATPase subunit n=1 Tax=Vulcanisaeta thermophila TaxID=867917 RepID=UPI00085342FF|nr:V-type ATPase subunit [Vulcanisaeta thermophila]